MSQFFYIFLHCRDPAILDGLDLTEDERRELIDNINRRLTPQAVKIRAGNVAYPNWQPVTHHSTCRVVWPSPLLLADIEVACYGYEGIDAVKDALRAGLNCSTEAMPIRVTITPFNLFWLLVKWRQFWRRNLFCRSTWSLRHVTWWPPPLWSARRVCLSLTRPWQQSRRRLRRKGVFLTSKWRYWSTHFPTNLYFACINNDVEQRPYSLDHSD